MKNLKIAFLKEDNSDTGVLEMDQFKRLVRAHLKPWNLEVENCIIENIKVSTTKILSIKVFNLF